MDDGWDDSGWGEPTVTSPRNSSVTMSSNSSFPDWSSDSTVTKSGHKGYLHRNDYMSGNIGRGRGISPVNRSQNRENNAVPGITTSSSWAPVDEIDDWTTDFSSQKQSNQPSLNGNTLTIFIPVHETGRIIGRQGSTVKDLQYQSGARINVGRDAINFETKIEITGNENQRDKALSLIERITGGSYGIGSRDNESKTEEKKEEVYFDWAEAVKESEEATKAKWAALAPVVKNFYIEDPEVTNMTLDDVSQFRQNNNNITISHFSEDDERKFPNPCVNFRQAFNKFPDILSEIERNGFEKPSPIQAQSWPVLLQGIDLIGIAQTGTGKTLAYLLPAMIHIEGQTTPRNKRTGPTALILAPTRELAQQIEKEAKKYSYRGIKTICIYGGADRRDQSNRAQSGVEIVIATPGRLNDLCAAKIIDLTSVSYLVLDEADRMLDMGFEPQIKKVMIDIRPDRQTVMMSATWPPGVRQLALNYMDKPFQIYVNTLNLAACHSVTQKVIFKSFEEKRPYLEEFIRGMAPDDKVIVFVGKKIMCDEISSDMALKGIDVQSIHGDRDQADREQALEDLKTGQVRVLIATDVASRGLDIDDITHILNLDFPRNIEEYVHRIGRTGRAGKSGTSITIMSREDWKHAKKLIDILLEAHQEVPDELREMAQRYKAHQEKKTEEERVYGIRGGGGSGCFKCGQEGHFSRECPPGGGGGLRGVGGFSAGGGGFGGGGRRGGGRW